jgi:hypothetical protein
MSWAAAERLAAFEGQDRTRCSIIEVRWVTRISDSCGFAVPLMDHVGDRDLLLQSHSRRDDAALADYAADEELAQHRRACGSGPPLSRSG